MSETTTSPPNIEVKYAHLKHMIAAFAIGILHADPDFIGYELPPKYEDALRHFTRLVQASWPRDDSLIPYGEITDLTWIFSAACFPHGRMALKGHPSHAVLVKIMEEWNTWKGAGREMRGSGIGDPPRQQREFIDVNALVRKAAMFLERELCEQEIRVPPIK